MKPEAIDLSHHLSDVAKARQPSPLKGLMKYITRPDIISLAGGLPSPAYFPFADISATVLAPESFPLEVTEESSAFSWLWKLFGSDKDKTSAITIPKYPVSPGDINLATALQYGMAGGLPQLQNVVNEFSARVYQPAYSNYATLMNTGSTDGWSKVVQTLCNPGEGVLVSKWTYPSAMAAMLPYGISPVAVDIDGEGMRADSLRDMLAGWDEAAQGMPRPRVIYAVPIGENPTGITTRLARKKEIYQICVDFDIVLVEDDPYFVLQEGEYVPKAQRKAPPVYSNDDEFIASLEPSYLKLDYQGRVIRLDTFSKTIAPGCRLGWFTAQPLFIERLERVSETSTQAPCGIGQAVVTSLMMQWGYDGFLRWLKGIRMQYTLRRDFFVDCLAEEFLLAPTYAATGEMAGSRVLNAYVKPTRRITDYFNEKAPLSDALFSFAPPTSGMFVWLKVHFDQHPSFAKFGEETLEMQLWIALADAGLLLGPGAMFSPKGDWTSTQSGHFRISFSFNSNEEFKRAVAIFGATIRKFMGQ